MKEEIVGKVFTTNNRGDCVVTKYVGCDEVHIKFLDTGFERVTDTNSLRKGQVKDASLSKTEKKYVVGKRDIAGEVFENTKGEKYEVLEKLSTAKFKIKFIDSGYETEVKKIAIEIGSIKDRKTLNEDKQLMIECFYDKKLGLDFHIVELTHRKGERKFIVETLDGHIRLTTNSETILSGKVSERLEVLPVCLEQPLGFSKVGGNVLYNNQDFNELTTYLANIFFYMQDGRLFHRYISYKTLNSDFKSKLQNQSYGVEIKDNDNYVTVLGVKFYRSDVIKLLSEVVHSVSCVAKQESMVTNLGLEHEYSIWLGMVNRCNTGYAKLSKEFEVFWDWLDWAKKQKGFMCKDNKGNIFQMESDLFSEEKTYAPDTVVFVPNSINQMCKPSKKGELPKGIQYFSDKAKPYRAYSPYDGLQKHLGYFKTMEEALTASIAGRREYLSSLRDLYSATVESKVFEELMKPKWYM